MVLLMSFLLRWVRKAGFAEGLHTQHQEVKRATGMFPILSRQEGMMTAMFVSREWKQDQFGIIIQQHAE